MKFIQIVKSIYRRILQSQEKLSMQFRYIIYKGGPADNINYRV